MAVQDAQDRHTGFLFPIPDNPGPYGHDAMARTDMIAWSAALRKPTDALDRGPDLAVYVVGDSYGVGSGDVLIDVRMSEIASSAKRMETSRSVMLTTEFPYDLVEIGKGRDATGRHAPLRLVELAADFPQSLQI
jgi:hypothetical protein